MRKHIVPIILLTLAVTSFIMSYFAGDGHKDCYEILAFIFSTVAALLEIVIAVRSDRKTEEKILDLEDNQIDIHVEDETLFIGKRNEL